jgi:mRNA-degrading endonuclease RelE of RelBE toxin-antitoxin system
MPTTVSIPPEAARDIKHLRRKYPAITSEIAELVKRLENDERPGDQIPHVGYEVYKVRLRNPSAGRGKSGGFRVVYYVQLEDRVFLLRVYSKTEQSDISPERLRQTLEDLALPGDDDDSNDE